MQNEYMILIEKISKNNKYTKWYLNIIKESLIRETFDDCYYERHHILPKCFGMGGEEDINNISILTAREHFIVHYCATKMFDGLLKHKMTYAFNMFRASNQHQEHRYINSRLYCQIKSTKNAHIRLYKKENVKYVYCEDVAEIYRLISLGWSKDMTSEYKVGRVGNMKGKKHSDITREKISKAHRGKLKGPMSTNIRKKISESNKGRSDSLQTRLKKSQAVKSQYEMGLKSQKGENNPMFGKKRKAIYNPNTMERKFIDITYSSEELSSYLSNGWLLGMPKKY